MYRFCGGAGSNGNGPCQRGADRSRRPFNSNREDRYIFFSEHTFVAASHVPPAFSQSAAFFAVVTFPANAGIANPSASAKANVERSVFMAITPYTRLSGKENASQRPRFRRNGGEEFRYVSERACVFAAPTDYLDSYRGGAGMGCFRMEHPFKRPMVAPAAPQEAGAIGLARN